MGENTAHVITELECIENGDYKTTGGEPQLSNVFLTLVGIPTGCKIVKNADFVANSLTWRSIVHLILIDERRIVQKPPIITEIAYNKPTTASLSALLHLVSAPDFTKSIQEKPLDIRKAQKNAKTEYIGKKIINLTSRASEISDFLTQLDGIDINVDMNEMINSLNETEQEILRASRSSRTLLSQIYEASGKLEEYTFLHDRYNALETQYISDLKRLRFLIDGRAERSEKSKNLKCPFCDGYLPENEQQMYVSASKEEAQAIATKLEGLKEVIADIIIEQKQLEEHLLSLKRENNIVITLIDNELAPRAAELRTKLEEYRRIVEKKHELVIIKHLADSMNDDLGDIADEDSLPFQYKPKDQFSDDFYKKMSEYLSEMLEECNYENFTTARFDKTTFDAVVNHKKKKGEGKGFMAFVNTVVAFTTMKYLSLHGKYAPGILIMDSPILTLKENIKKEEEAPDGMKASLFRYLHDNQMYGQVIIIENELPVGDFPNANRIWFAGDEAGPNDRYGFLIGVRQGHQGRV